MQLLTHSPRIASYSWNLWTFSTGSYLSSLWTSSTGRLGDLLHASYDRLAAGKGRHVYIPIKMASGVQDVTCVFVEVAGSFEKNCPGIVCSPLVVSKCLGEAHRRLELFTLHYITKSFFFPVNFFKKIFFIFNTNWISIRCCK